MSGPLKVWIDRSGRLLRLRLDRPKANILDAALVGALEGAFVQQGGAAELRGVLIDASGAHFSFGASIEEHLPERCAAMLAGFHRLVLRLFASPVPVLVAVRGQCLGGGLELASAGHLLFAAPDAKFGQPEIQIGVFAPAASCLLPERIGLAAAEDLLLSGRSIGADDACAMGLVTEIADDPEAAALGYFDRHLAPKSASSLRFATRAIRQGTIEKVSAKLAAIETMYLQELMATQDAVEGLSAFIEKRPARWKDL
ncbi:MAG: cyclohexa-1,5-dienecarbonyl-CoA hydratase [Roseiarcus sp.]|uniref:cyclohexa-1,5-dienecarbonyl-CoA hydratase n=1 Tax=Roseiarcus sp. TaxID=1969460 RepID=UPI003C45445C